jgi:hypothetical protein
LLVVVVVAPPVVVLVVLQLTLSAAVHTLSPDTAVPLSVAHWSWCLVREGADPELEQLEVESGRISH